MTKKNLNWRIEESVKEAFGQTAEGRYDAKKLWVCATAAVLMYLDADEETKMKYDAEAMATSSQTGTERVLAKRSIGPKASRSRGPR